MKRYWYDCHVIDFILFCLLGTSIVAIAVFGGYVSSNNRRHRITFYIMGGISFILILFTGYNTYLARTAAETAARRLDDSIKSLETSSKAITTMSAETVRVGHLNTQLQERLLEQTKTITSLSKESINTTTGGSSFGYISLLNICSSDSWIPAFVHIGKYPLYGVSARITDLDKFRKMPKDSSLLDWFSANTNIDIGDIVEGFGKLYFEKSIPIVRDNVEHSYNIFITARNGYWMQFLKVINLNGKCSTATRIYKEGTPKKLVFEQIMDDFRRNHKGKIDWSNH